MKKASLRGPASELVHALLDHASDLLGAELEEGLDHLRAGGVAAAPPWRDALWRRRRLRQTRPFRHSINRARWRRPGPARRVPPLQPLALVAKARVLVASLPAGHRRAPATFHGLVGLAIFVAALLPACFAYLPPLFALMAMF